MATKTLAVPAVPESSPFPQLEFDREIDSLVEIVDRVLDRREPEPLSPAIYQSMKNEAPRFWVPRFGEWLSLEQIAYATQQGWAQA